MYRGIPIFLLSFVLLTTGCEEITYVCPEPPPPADTTAVSQGNTQFALDLYKQLADSNEGNLFCSPLSISTALAMTYAGARGETAEEMAKTLHYPQDEQFHRAMAQLQHDLTNPDRKGVQVRIANSLFGQQGYPWEEDFLKLTRKEYGAELQQVDFVRQTEAARQTINGWVEEQTEKKIQDLIPDGVLNVDTRMVLANAIYFKGKWAHEFKPNATQETNFHVDSDTSVKVPMMYQQEKFNFHESNDVQILELPYQDKQTSMLILLPKQKDGLAEVEKNLSVEKLNEWTEKLRETKVWTWLPKFRFTRSFQLADTLEEMGMPRAFISGQADFSGMNGGKEQLFISEVIHKAFVEVNEEGTEAAAATGVVIMRAAAEILPQFRADHPFLFLIRSKADGSILFVGRVIDPTKTE